MGSSSNNGDLNTTAVVPSQVTVQEGETAYRIARRYKPDSVTMDQMLLALLRENPGVFKAGNLHRIRAGSVLAIPSHLAIHKASPAEASQIVQGQNHRTLAGSLRVGAKATIAVTAPPTVAAPTPRSVRPLAETVRPEAGLTPTTLLPSPRQNTAMRPSTEARVRSSIPVGTVLLLLGSVMLLFLNRNRIQDLLRRRPRSAESYQPRSGALDKRTPSVLEIMVGIRDFNRQIRLEIGTWINSQSPHSIKIRPSVTDCKPLASIIPASGFQQIAQGDFSVFQKRTPASRLLENNMDVRFLGHGFHLDFEFFNYKPAASVLTESDLEPKALEISQKPSHTLCPSSSPTTFQRTQSMKASGFSFSPSEYLANQQIQMMSLEEEGIYIRLLSYCWQNGSIPKDPEQAARLVGKGASTTVVASVLRLFQATQNPQELTHLDLQRQREHRMHWKEKSAAGGRKSAASRKGGSTTLEAVVEKRSGTTRDNTKKTPISISSPQKLAPPTAGKPASEPPEIDSEASQEAFERYAIAEGLFATDGAFLHRQWRSKDSELRASWTSGWRQLMAAWKAQGRFPSQASNPGGDRPSHKERLATMAIKTAAAAVNPSQSSRDFPKFTASKAPYSFRFDGFQTSDGSKP